MSEYVRSKVAKREEGGYFLKIKLRHSALEIRYMPK